MRRASNIFYVIACHKLLELVGTIGRTIVTLQLVGDSMRGEVSLQDVNHFLASLVLKLVYFEVAGVVVYSKWKISYPTVSRGRFRILSEISGSFCRSFW